MPSNRKKFSNKSGSLKSVKSSNQNNIASHVPKNQIWIYGKHPVKEVLLNKKRKVFKILITKNNQVELENFIKENNLKIDKSNIFIVSGEDISINFTSKIIHQGFAILCSVLHCITDNEFLANIKKDNLENILILDQLTDPHNIGAIIRSAISFGVKNIVLLKQSFSGENATICKSSSGTIENANIILAGNLNNFILKLKYHGYWVAGLDGSGKNSFDDVKLHDNICLIIGNEGSGIRQLVKKNCDLLLKIPISDKVESLNASNAACIALWEINKK